VSCTHLAHCVELLRAEGLPVPVSALEWFRPGSPLLAPRLGYRPPDASLQLHISLGGVPQDAPQDPAQARGGRPAL